jgi:NAD(P)H-hydrate epimerase
MRDFDRRAFEEFGVPSIVLMENAGRSVAAAVADLLGSLSGKHIAVIAGKGNNGGDGFVAARHLRDNGAQVSVCLLGEFPDVKGDAKINLDILLKTGQPVKVVHETSDLAPVLDRCDVIVDAIFGTGLRGDISGLPAEVIKAINEANRPVVAVDIPSGLDADTGRVLGVCVNAEVTVTFALPKVGLVVYPGASYVGRLIVAEIGIPRQLYEEVNVELTSGRWVVEHFPKRPPDAHKGTFGTVLVVAGSSGFTGAAAMSAEAVLRSGAGLCTLAVPASLQDIMAAKLTEVMTRPLPETEVRSISSTALEGVLDLCEKANAVVLGCGLGTHQETCKFVCDFIRAVAKPVVVDADGLNCLSKATDVLEGGHAEMVITPHPGEMARLLGTTTAEIQSDRIGAARQASNRFHCITVLKGARTVIADPTGRVFINTTGNSGMATGGTGDILAGIIGGLLAQGISPLEAAVCGTYIHGLAGDITASDVGQVGMIAGDLLRALPRALKELVGF